jgi:hypothetical protein
VQEHDYFLRQMSQFLLYNKNYSSFE